MKLYTLPLSPNRAYLAMVLRAYAQILLWRTLDTFEALKKKLWKRIILFSIVLFLYTVGFSTAMAQPLPDLTWIGNKSYNPPPAGYINGIPYWFLPNAAFPCDVPNIDIVFFKNITNTGESAVAGGYSIREEIYRRFYVDGRAINIPVYNTTLIGPGLSPNTNATISDVIPNLRCGRFFEVLTIDPDNQVEEHNETNNVQIDEFLVLSSEWFNIRYNEIVAFLDHRAGPTIVGDFIHSSGPGPAEFRRVRCECSGESTADIVPNPGLPIPGGVIASMRVTPMEHQPLFALEVCWCTITYRSWDKCHLRQRTGRVTVIHGFDQPPFCFMHKLMLWLRPYQWNDILGFVEVYNENLDAVPSFAKNMLAHQKVNVIDTETNEVILSVVFVDNARIEKVFEGALPDPTIEIYTSVETLSNIIGSNDPVSAFQTALKYGDVKIEGVGIENDLKILPMNMLGKISVRFLESPYDIRKGEEKKVTCRDKYAIMKRNAKNVRLLEFPGEKGIVAINKYGAISGYTTKNIQKLVTHELSPSAGIYHIESMAMYSLLAPTSDYFDDHIVGPIESETTLKDVKNFLQKGTKIPGGRHIMLFAGASVSDAFMENEAKTVEKYIDLKDEEYIKENKFKKEK